MLPSKEENLDLSFSLGGWEFIQFEGLYPRDRWQGHSLKRTQVVHSVFTKKNWHLLFLILFFYCHKWFPGSPDLTVSPVHCRKWSEPVKVKLIYPFICIKKYFLDGIKWRESDFCLPRQGTAPSKVPVTPLSSQG